MIGNGDELGPLPLLGPRSKRFFSRQSWIAHCTDEWWWSPNGEGKSVSFSQAFWQAGAMEAKAGDLSFSLLFIAFLDQEVLEGLKG